MNQLPINKIILASFAFVLTHWKKMVEISILPFLLALPLFSLSTEIIELAGILTGENPVKPEDIQPPENLIIYSLLFLYGQANLATNMYRLVIFGVQSVSWMPIFKLRQIIGFIGLTFLINLVTGVPLMLANLIWVYLVVYFLIIPIVLNFINIATDQPLKFKWGLSFSTQINLFFLQVALPMLVGGLASLAVSSIGLPVTIDWVVKVVMFYWSLVSLALCYQLITKQPQSNTSK